MANVMLSIGGREYEFTCEPGEEDKLKRAASLLDEEASRILEGAGASVTESRIMLLSGILIADRILDQERSFRDQQTRINKLEAYIRNLEAERERGYADAGADGGAAERMVEEMVKKLEAAAK
ncbi:cell division protein ZapA [Paracoccaceae bacterium GXU_MW_L88]